MAEAMDIGRQIYDLFRGSGATVSIYFVVLLILVLQSKNERVRHFILYPAIVVLLLIWNPILLQKVVMSGRLSMERYVRMYWLLPIPITMAYGAVKLMRSAGDAMAHHGKETVGKLPCHPDRKVSFAAVAIVVAMILLGDYMFKAENYSDATNLYKIPQAALEVTDAIREDAGASAVEPGEVRIVVPESISSYVKQYDGEIKMLFGRYGYGYDIYDRNAEAIVWNMHEEQLDMNWICDYARAGGCNYVVVENWKPQVGSLEERGYAFLGDVAGYLIYRDMETLQ